MVVTSATGPVQLAPALMPNKLFDVLPSAFRMSRLPQPDSCAACATMKLAGMPVCASAARAEAVLRCTKSSWRSLTVIEVDAVGAAAAAAGGKADTGGEADKGSARSPLLFSNVAPI